MASIASPSSSPMAMESPHMTSSGDKLDANGNSARHLFRPRFHDHDHQQNRFSASHARSLSWGGAGSVTAPDDDLFMSDVDPEFYHAALFSPAAAQRQEQFRVLGTLGLTGLAFFVSCGGPIGSEPLVSAGGPLVGLIALAAYVAFCVFPFTYVVAELCSTFPENGGYTVWIMTVFGPFWGFQAGYWSWVAAALNNAIYPGLMYSIISDAFDWNLSATAQYFLKASIAILLCVPSLLSVRFVAAAAFVLLVVISALFVLFSSWGFSDGANDWSALLDVRNNETVTAQGGAGSHDAAIDWGLLVNSLFWNFDGLYDASIIGGEVLNPKRTYPRMLIINVSIMVAIYVIPLVSAVTSTSGRLSWLDFDEDSFPTIASTIGGKALHAVTLVSSVLSVMGLYTTTIMFQSFQVLGMAQMRLLPTAFRTRHKTFQTPQYAVLLSMLTTMVLLMFDYESILGITNAFSAGIQVLIVLTMLRLRRALPHITRPTRVPGPFALVCVVLVPVSIVFLYILFTALEDAKTALVFCALLVPGVIYGTIRRGHVRQELQERARQHQRDLLAQVLPLGALP